MVAAGDEAHLALLGASRAGEELDRVDDVLGALEIDAVDVDLVALRLRGEKAPLHLVIGQSAKSMRLLLEHDGVQLAVALPNDVQGLLVHHGDLLVGDAQDVSRSQELDTGSKR